MVEIYDTADLRPDTRLTENARSWIYNGLDCAVTSEIIEALNHEVDDVSENIYRNVSCPLQGPILDMNRAGVLTDAVEVYEMLRELEQDIELCDERLRRIINDGFGIPFDPSKPKQLGEFLYECLPIPEKKKRNSKGGFSRTVDRQALQALHDEYYFVRPLLGLLLDRRDFVKQTQFLKTQVDSDGRMRCNFNIAGTNTGRLNSSYSDMGTGTNLQNVGRRLRRVFVAPKGKKLCNVDLEQADSRNVGATCWNRFVDSHGEEFAGSYLDACESGDLHTQVTRMARPELDWPDSPDDWRGFAEEPLEIFRGKGYRDLSKNLGHGSNYLLSDQGALLKIPGLTLQSVREFRARYFGAFPCIPEWHKAVKHDLEETASVTTIWGRRRYFFGRLNDPRTHRGAVAYEGQSSTADEINHGLIKVWNLGNQWPGFQLLVQVHDSILFEYDEECEDEIIPWAIETLPVSLDLARGRRFTVPVEAKVGWNWGDFNDNPKHGRLNPDGLKKWKGHDTRTRTQEPRLYLTL